MDIKEPGNRLSQDVARELLIAISYCMPDNVMNSDCVSKNFENADGRAAVTKADDGAEKFRSELISISEAESPETPMRPVFLGRNRPKD